MTTLYLRPTAVGDETNINNSTGATHWGEVDEAVSDGNTTRVYTISATYQRDLYGVGDTTIQATINWVKIWINCSAQSGGICRAKTAVKTNSTAYDGAANDLPNDTVYYTYSTQYTTNPQTGLVWTWAEINAIQAGVSLHGDGVTTVASCTQVYVEIDYTFKPRLIMIY